MKLKLTPRQSYTLASKYFERSWSRLLDECQILLNVNLTKPDQLLLILHQINDNIQFIVWKSKTGLPFLDIMINKSGTKNWMDIYNKPTDSKRPIYAKPATTLFKKYTFFSLAKRIYTTGENKNVKEKRYKELKEKNITNTKIS